MDKPMAHWLVHCRRAYIYAWDTQIDRISNLVPTFRHDQGGTAAYKTFGRKLFRYSALQDTGTRRRPFDMISEILIKVKATRPTPFHELMGRLAEGGQLLRLYTRNVDGLDTDMPSLARTEGGANRWPIAIPLHGRIDTLFCERCGNRQPFDRALFNNPTVSAECGGCKKFPIGTRSGRATNSVVPSQLRPRMLFYEDPLDLDDNLIIEAHKFALKQKVDTVLMVGTSLSTDVKSAREMVKTLCGPEGGKHKKTVWINPQPPPKDLKKLFDVVVLAGRATGPAVPSQIRPRICERCHNRQPFNRSLFDNATVSAKCSGCEKFPVHRGCLPRTICQNPPPSIRE